MMRASYSDSGFSWAILKMSHVGHARIPTRLNFSRAEILRAIISQKNQPAVAAGQAKPCPTGNSIVQDSTVHNWTNYNLRQSIQSNHNEAGEHHTRNFDMWRVI